MVVPSADIPPPVDRPPATQPLLVTASSISTMEPPDISVIDNRERSRSCDPRHRRGWRTRHPCARAQHGEQLALFGAGNPGARDAAYRVRTQPTGLTGDLHLPKIVCPLW